jgi:hypothetical protein
MLLQIILQQLTIPKILSKVSRLKIWENPAINQSCTLTNKFVIHFLNHKLSL